MYVYSIKFLANFEGFSIIKHKLILNHKTKTYTVEPHTKCGIFESTKEALQIEALNVGKTLSEFRKNVKKLDNNLKGLLANLNDIDTGSKPNTNSFANGGLVRDLPGKGAPCQVGEDKQNELVYPYTAHKDVCRKLKLIKNDGLEGLCGGCIYEIKGNCTDCLLTAEETKNLPMCYDNYIYIEDK